MTCHADTVGSFLRPKTILELREKKEKGEVDEVDLQKVEDEEIRRLVEKQTAAGLKIVSDGEYRRDSFMLDFPLFHGGVKIGEFFPFDSPIGGSKLAISLAKKRKLPFVYDKLTFNPNHPEFKAFEYLKSITPAGILPKVIIPSPEYFFLFRPKGNLFPSSYGNVEEFYDDLGLIYKETILKYYGLGARLIQIDEPAWFIYPFLEGKGDINDVKRELQKEMDITVKVLKAAEFDRLKDLQLIIHLCRGNGETQWEVPVTYADVLPALVAIQPNILYMEYDDYRSGTFDVLKEYASQLPNTRFFLGLVTTKNTILEPLVSLETRLHEAAQYVSLSRLGVCTQCGFATGKAGNPGINEEAMWGKVQILVETARRVWGDK